MFTDCTKQCVEILPDECRGREKKGKFIFTAELFSGRSLGCPIQRAHAHIVYCVLPAKKGFWKVPQEVVFAKYIDSL